uniref:beta-defensin 118 n=1 Tax=Myodes glareolus TaxID=447135 RepID=UPI00202218C9|nr:beta-defensin 118 [Myodes glareolus]
MRLLLLALPVLALLPQVIPAYGGEKKCLNGLGSCRKNCKDGEMFWDTCKYRRVCCIPDTRERKRKVSVAVGWTTGTTEATPEDSTASAAFTMDFDF